MVVTVAGSVDVVLTLKGVSNVSSVKVDPPLNNLVSTSIKEREYSRPIGESDCKHCGFERCNCGACNRECKLRTC